MISYWTSDILIFENASIHSNYYVTEDGDLGYYITILDYSKVRKTKIIWSKWFNDN